MGKVAARRTNSSGNRCAGKFSLFEDRSGASEQLTISAVQATLTCKKLRRRLRAVDEAASDSGRAHGRGSLEAGRGSPSFNPRYRPKAGRSKQNPDGMPVVAMALQIRPPAGRRRRCWAAAMEMPSAARHRAHRRPPRTSFHRRRRSWRKLLRRSSRICSQWRRQRSARECFTCSRWRRARGSAGSMLRNPRDIWILTINHNWWNTFHQFLSRSRQVGFWRETWRSSAIGSRLCPSIGKPRPRDGRLRWRQQHHMRGRRSWHFGGDARGGAEEYGSAVDRRRRRPDLSPLGSKGREACLLCKGREAATGCRLILVSAFMWHTGAHETQAGTGGVVVSVQSTRRTPGRVMGFQHFCNRLLVTPSRLRLQGRIDPPKGGTVQERRSLVRARLLRSEPRQCPNDRRDQGAG